MIFKADNLIAAFSSGAQNMSFVYGNTKEPLANRRDFLDSVGIDYRQLVCAKQTHSGNIKVVEEKDKGSGALSFDGAIADTDALVTSKRNVPLSIFTADCLPVFLYDSQKHLAGLAHAGWRGAKVGIAVKTAKVMQDKFNTTLAHLYVGFGPCIRECCYEVGNEFRDYFSKGLNKRGSAYYLDLIEITTSGLLDLGVSRENISDSGVCTSCCNKDFFSYRKEGPISGRIISVIMLK